MNSEKPTRQQSPPDEIKKQFRHQYASTQGPASFFEVDDPENWSQVTASTRGWVGRSLDFHDLMGAGHEKPVSEALYANLPGRIGALWSEIKQRAIYEGRLQMMGAESWKDLQERDGQQ